MNVFDDIQFYLFNHHHYIDEPADSDRYDSTWVNYPNGNFDAEVAHELYQRWTREMLLAEQLGFDAIAVNEHHQTIYSMQPATSVRAAYLAALTKRVKILVAGVPINLSWPSRVAEEYAMLDVMSNGRMEYGFPLGTGMEYWSNAGQLNPTTARARFRENLSVILKTWTEDGPVRHDGEFYNYRFLNVWPRPMQKPYPKIYIVGSGSQETVDVATDFRAGYSIVFTPIEQQLKAMANFREAAESKGWTVQPDDTIFTVICYVADTDEEAVREARPHIEKFFSWMHRVPPQFLSPPGYVSRSEFSRPPSPTGRAPRGTTWSPSGASSAARPTRWPTRCRIGPRRRSAAGCSWSSSTATCPSGRPSRTCTCSPRRSSPASGRGRAAAPPPRSWRG